MAAAAYGIGLSPETVQAHRLKLIKASVPTFWNPHEFWLNWPDGLRRVLPAIANPASSYMPYDNEGLWKELNMCR